MATKSKRLPRRSAEAVEERLEGPRLASCSFTERDLEALVSPAESPARPWYAAARVFLDGAAALVLLVLTAPVMLAAMALVRLTSRGPALYTQVRLGRGGRPFRIVKIRTMVDNCESLTGPRWSVPGDPRITTVGKYLRALHIDELPQLFNVLKGEMALIGPRPERPEIAADLKNSGIDNFDARLVVRPGITGFAQVQLPADVEVSGVRNKLHLDLTYIRGMGPVVDAKILFCTVLKMIGVRYETSKRILRPHLDEPLPEFESEPTPARGQRPSRRVA